MKNIIYACNNKNSQSIIKFLNKPKLFSQLVIKTTNEHGNSHSISKIINKISDKPFSKFILKNFCTVIRNNKFNDSEAKLTRLRDVMKENNIDVYILPRSDAHNNEYLAQPDERISSLSNFTGTNAICLISYDVALIWTDGRYYIQAEKELDKNIWTMMKIEKGHININDYIQKVLYDKLKSENNGKIRIGVNKSQITCDAFQNLIHKLEKLDIEVVDDEKNIIDQMRPIKDLEYSKKKVIIHEIKYTGESPLEKYKKVFNSFESSSQSDKIINKTKENNIKIGLIIVRLDDIAWLTNLRGNDIEFNPLFFSYGILIKDYSKDNEIYLNLYSNKEKFVEENVQEHLKKNRIILNDYNSFQDDIDSFNGLLISNKNALNQRLYEKLLNHKKNLFHLINVDLIQNLKSIKNHIQIKSLRESNIRDGVCLIRFYSWLENRLNEAEKDENIKPPTEYECTLKLVEFRKKGKNYMGESFAAISASGPHAAIIHFRPDKKTSPYVDINKIYLLDSGAQYLDGTTDITRALYFGKKPTDYEKEMYTRVLLGNLAIERCKFPVKGEFNGSYFDSLSRQYLWHISQDFLHSTGHGVGFFLNVHEGPQRISIEERSVKFEPGMIITNEPGFYLENQFGIRIENNLLVSKLNDKDDYLYFNNLTLVPYERKLLYADLISKETLGYINGYHKLVREKLAPFFDKNNKEDKLAYEYLIRKTDPII